MEVKRRELRNKLNIEKKSINLSVIRDEDTIRRLKNSNMNIEYCCEKIEKLKEDIEKKKSKLEDIIKDLGDIENGLLDNQITEDVAKNKIEIDRKHKATMYQKKLKKEEKEKQKDISKEYWNKIKKSSRNTYQKERDIKYGWKEFNKAILTLPNYITKNLKEMPNNKGYIWRSCQFFGELKEEKNQPIVLFEKYEKNIMLIHEITADKHIIYKKEGKNKKILQNVIQRRKINIGYNLLDYVNE